MRLREAETKNSSFLFEDQIATGGWKKFFVFIAFTFRLESFQLLSRAIVVAFSANLNVSTVRCETFQTGGWNWKVNWKALEMIPVCCVEMYGTL